MNEKHRARDREDIPLEGEESGQPLCLDPHPAAVHDWPLYEPYDRYTSRADQSGMRWVTRRHIRVNRTATAWLVRRFIDPEATFAFVEPSEVETVERETGAVGFDAPGARYPHKDEQGRCSFEALVEEYRPNDPVLQQLALIVRSADFQEALSLTPEGAGLRATSRGFPLVARDDYETVERAGFLYDALYASLQDQQRSRG